MLNVSTSPANASAMKQTSLNYSDVLVLWNGNIWVFRIHKSVTNLEKHSIVFLNLEKSHASYHKTTQTEQKT